LIVPKSPCPGCGITIDAATCIDHPGAAPVPGDGTICWHCGTLLAFGPDLVLALMTPEQIARLPDHARVAFQRVLRAVRGRPA
jgi:hypothetical protein